MSPAVARITIELLTSMDHVAKLRWNVYHVEGVTDSSLYEFGRLDDYESHRLAGRAPLYKARVGEVPP